MKQHAKGARRRLFLWYAEQVLTRMAAFSATLSGEPHRYYMWTHEVEDPLPEPQDESPDNSPTSSPDTSPPSAR